MNETNQSPRKKLLWSLLFFVIACATVWAVISQSRAFSLAAFGAYVSGMSKPWLLAAAGAMLCFILFEGAALIAICRAFGYSSTPARGFAYAASDIYFSAITPSATGGQPACAYFMIKDGIPPAVTTAALVANLAMYVASILILGGCTLILRPEIFLCFGTLSRALIAIGYLLQLALAMFFVLLLKHSSLLHAICRGALRFLSKIRLVRREEELLRRLEGHMEEYGRCVRMIADRKGAMAKALLYNLIQRAAMISVPMFVFLADGGAAAGAARIWAVQCCAVIGSNTVPIPGAMGVSDYIMLDGFANFLSGQSVINFELLSRALSFYSCVILCGIATLIYYLIVRRRGRKAKRP